MGDAYISVGADLTDLRAGLREADRLGSQFANNFSGKLTAAVTAPFKAMSDALSTVFTGGLLAIGMRAMNGLIDLFKDAASEAFNFSKSLQLQEVGWKTMLGGAQTAKVAIDALKQVAIVSQFTYEPIQRIGRGLLGVGTNLKDVIPIISELNDVVAAFGGSEQMLNAVAHTYERVSAQQRIFARDLNALASQGIPSWQIAAKAFGMSHDEMRKHMKNGSVDAKTFLDALRKYSQGFAGAAEEASHTFIGAMNTIKDAGLFASQTAFAPLFEVLTKLVDTVGIFMRSANFQAWAASTGAALRVVIEMFGNLSKTIGNVVGGLKGSLGGIFDGVLGTVQSLGNAISSGITSALNPKAGAGKAGSQAIQDLSEDVEGAGQAAKVASASFEDFGVTVTGAVGPAGAAVAAFQAIVSGSLARVQQDADATNAALAESLGAGAGKAFLSAIQQVRDLQGTLPGLQNAIDAQQGVVDGWKGRIDAANKSIADAERGVKALERALRPLEDALQAARDTLEAERQKTEDAKNEVEKYRDELQKAKDDLNEFANARLAGTRAFEDALHANDQQRAQVQRELIDSQEADLQHQREIQKQVDAQQKVVEQWQKRVDAAKDAVDRQNAAVKRAQKALDDATAAYDAQNEALKERERELAVLERAGQVYEDQVTAATKAVKTQKDQLDAAKNAYADLERQINEATNAVKAWSQAILPGEEAFQDKLFGIDQQIAAIQLKLLKLKMADQPTHASAELERQLSIVNTEVEAAVKNIQKLREQGSPVDAIDKANQAYADLILKQDEIYKRIRAEQSGQQVNTPEVQDLTKQLQDLQDQAQQTRLEQTLQIDPLRRQLEKLAAEGTKVGEGLNFDDILKGLKDAKGKVSDLTKQLEPQAKVVEREQAALDDANAALERATKIRDTYKDSIDAQQQALKDEEAALADAREKGLKPYQAAVAQAKDRLDALQGALQGAQKGLDAQRDRLAAVRDHMGETSQRTKDLEEALRLLDETAAKIKLDEQLKLGDAEYDLGKLRDTAKEMTFEEIRDGMQKAQQRVDALKGSLDKAEAALKTQEGAQKTAEDAVNRASKAVDAQRRQIELANRAISDMRDAVDPLNESLDTEEKKLKNLQKAYADTKKQIDEYTAALRSAISVAADQAKDGKDKGSGVGSTPSDKLDQHDRRDPTNWMTETQKRIDAAIESAKKTTGEIRAMFAATELKAQELPGKIANYFADPEWGRKLGQSVYSSLFQININVGEWWAKNKGPLGAYASNLADGIGDWIKSPDGAQRFAANLGYATGYVLKWMRDTAIEVGQAAGGWLVAIDNYMTSEDGQREMGNIAHNITESIKNLLYNFFKPSMDSPVNVGQGGSASAFFGWLAREFGIPTNRAQAYQWWYDNVLSGVYHIEDLILDSFGALGINVAGPKGRLNTLKEESKKRFLEMNDDLNGKDGVVPTTTNDVESTWGKLDRQLNGPGGPIPTMRKNIFLGWQGVKYDLNDPNSGIMPGITGGSGQYWDNLGKTLNGPQGTVPKMTGSIRDAWGLLGVWLLGDDGKVTNTNDEIGVQWGKLALNLTNENTGTVPGLVRAVLKSFTWLYNLLVGQSIVPETTAAIKSAWDTLKGWLTGDTNGDPNQGTVIGDLVLAGKSLFEHWRAKGTETIRHFLGVDKDDDSLMTHFDNFSLWLVGGSTPGSEDGGSALGKMVGAGVGLFETWRSKAGTVMQNLVGNYDEKTGTLGWIHTLVDELTNNAKKLTDALTKPFTDSDGPIQSAMETTINGVIDILNKGLDAWKGLVNAFRSAVNWLYDALRLDSPFKDEYKGPDPIKHIDIGKREMGGYITNDYTLVGERGPELVERKGSQYYVHSNPETKKRLRGAGPGGTEPSDGDFTEDKPFWAVPHWLSGMFVTPTFMRWITYGAEWAISNAMTKQGIKLPQTEDTLMGDLTQLAVKGARQAAVNAAQHLFDKVSAAWAAAFGGDEATAGGYYPTPQGLYVFPVQGYKGSIGLHWGSYPGAADIFGALRAPIVAMRGGKVTSVTTADRDKTGGNTVFIVGDDGLKYYYAHGFAPPSVHEGQSVSTGQYLMPLGKTGNAATTSPHLHMGIGHRILTGTGPKGGAGEEGFDAVGFLRAVLAGTYNQPSAAGEFYPATTSAARAWITSALRSGGYPDNWSKPTSIIAWFESNDNPRSVNTWDSNFIAGHPSRGLMQTIPSTFNAYRRGGARAYSGNQGYIPGIGDLGDPGDIYNPIENIIAAMEYIRRGKGLSSPWDLKGVKNVLSGGRYQGYATGGRLDEEVWGLGMKSGTVYSFAEGNRPEWIVPEMPQHRIPKDFGGGAQVVVVEKGDTYNDNSVFNAHYATVQPERMVKHDLRLRQMLKYQAGRVR